MFDTGIWGVGLATRKCELNSAPLGADTESWVLRHDGGMYHNNEQKAKVTQLPEEGDVVVSLVVTCHLFYSFLFIIFIFVSLTKSYKNVEKTMDFVDSQ